MPLIDQIQQSAGGRDQNIASGAERANLARLLDPTEDDNVSNADMPAVRAEALEDLTGQLARGCEYQCPRSSRIGGSALAFGVGPHFGTLRTPGAGFGEPVQDGQREGRGLSGSGLGTSEYVATIGPREWP